MKICTYKDCMVEGFYVPEIKFPLGGTMSFDTIILCQKHTESFTPDTILRDLFKREEIRRVIRETLEPFGIDMPHPDDCSLAWRVNVPKILGPDGNLIEAKQ